MTRPEKDLFPTPKEIDLDCSCQDRADLCKHVAAHFSMVSALFHFPRGHGWD
ncbi:MAG: SWIM zinc finger family protein [Verrucomicrobiota bacterium]